MQKIPYHLRKYFNRSRCNHKSVQVRFCQGIISDVPDKKIIQRTEKNPYKLKEIP